MVQATSKHPIDYRPFVLIAFLVALAVNGALISWALWLNAQRPQVELSEPIVEGNTALCPGDTLDYRFTLSVSKKADVDLNTSVEATSAQNTASYTRFQRYTFDTQINLEIGRRWTLPPTYLDPVTGKQIAWQPGLYVQKTSADVIGGRDAPAKIEVPFEINASCPK